MEGSLVFLYLHVTWTREKKGVTAWKTVPTMRPCPKNNKSVPTPQCDDCDEAKGRETQGRR